MLVLKCIYISVDVKQCLLYAGGSAFFSGSPAFPVRTARVKLFFNFGPGGRCYSGIKPLHGPHRGIPRPNSFSRAELQSGVDTRP